MTFYTHAQDLSPLTLEEEMQAQQSVDFYNHPQYSNYSLPIPAFKTVQERRVLRGWFVRPAPSEPYEFTQKNPEEQS